MTRFRFKIHAFVAKYIPRFIGQWYFKLFVSDQDIKEIVGLGKARRIISDMAEKENPLVLRDDLVCMHCSCDLGSVNTEMSEEEAERIAALPMDEALKHMPFVMMFQISTGEPLILCHDCFAVKEANKNSEIDDEEETDNSNR